MIDLPPDYGQAVQAIVTCGVPAANITVPESFPGFIPSIQISDVGAVSHDKLQCIARSAGPIDVTIHVRAQALAYSSLVLDALRSRIRTIAEQWLNDRGMAEGLPSFSVGDSLSAFAVKAERHCRIAPGQALLVRGDDQTGGLDFTPSAPARLGADPLICITYVMELSGLREAGVGYSTAGVASLGDEPE